ncbi:hypothetical protein EYC84_004735 [Monilinia fructicola]|uniref:Uncharacterized protein n=1 Tax=Monilinia fructicola TaxID=38448 RepID=A0A5M9K1C9_MONFR|nr:hypothetical protein EYC84_004735 [Monilinia fructicola]
MPKERSLVYATVRKRNRGIPNQICNYNNRIKKLLTAAIAMASTNLRAPIRWQEKNSIIHYTDFILYIPRKGNIRKSKTNNNKSLFPNSRARFGTSHLIFPIIPVKFRDRRLFVHGLEDRASEIQWALGR